MIRLKNTGKNEHSEDCIYDEDDAMLYCKLILNDHELLVSARAVSYTHLTLPTKRIV